MKKNKVLICMAAVMLLVACPNNDNQEGSNSSSTTDSNQRQQSDNRISSLQIAIDETPENETLNLELSQYSEIKNVSGNININKSIKINSRSNLNLSQASLSVSADGVSLSGLSNANVTTTSALGSGSLRISSSSLNSLVLNGGGANSINLDNVTITDLTADYPWVRLHILDDKTKIMNFVAKQNCKIEDDLSTDTSNSNSFVEKLEIKENVIAEVKTVVDKLNILGDNAEVLLSRANSYIGSFTSNVSKEILEKFRLTSIEKVNVADILDSIPVGIDSDVKKQIQYKTSDCLVLAGETESAYTSVSYNFDGFVKAWKHFNDNSTDDNEKRIWSNYQNVRVLDKYKGKEISELAAKAFQMCQWLTTIDIGENVDEIGNLAFLGCSNLEKLYVRAENPPTVKGDKLFFAKGDTPTDETKIDKHLFDPTSDFISAECIDYFIEWYKESDFADPDCVSMINDFEIAFQNDIFKQMIHGISTIGEFLKSEEIWKKDGTLQMMGKYEEYPDISPSHIRDSIIAEWDKTISQTDMSRVTIYVPQGSLSAYQTAPVWSLYADYMEEIPGQFYESVHAE